MAEVILTTKEELVGIISRMMDAKLALLLDAINATQTIKHYSATLPKEEVQTQEPNERIVTERKLCEYLDITRVTAYKWRSSGRLPFIQIGKKVRYDLNKVMASLENMSVEKN